MNATKELLKYAKSRKVHKTCLRCKRQLSLKKKYKWHFVNEHWHAFCGRCS